MLRNTAVRQYSGMSPKGRQRRPWLRGTLSWMRHVVAFSVLAVLLGLTPGVSTGAQAVAASARRVAPIRPGALAVAPDGGLYIADDVRNQILKRSPDGRFTVAAGNGKRGFSGDGGRAVDARLNAPAGMVRGSGGTLYFADALNNRIRAISRSGTISTVAGNGRGGWPPNGSSARAAPILSPEEKQVFVDTFTKSGFTGGINWYRNMSRNWQRSADIDYTVRVPSLMIMAENDHVLPPSSADGMEKLIPDLEKYLVRDSGHWTQQEKPGEVSAKLIEWRRRRFG